jgi:CBS domain-containing protein
MVSLRELDVKDVMIRSKLTTSKNAPLSEVLGVMKQNRVHELPVLEKRKVVGLVSYDQLIRSRRVPISASVKSVMIPSPSVSEDEKLPDVADIMLTGDLKAVPVTHKGKF